MATLTTSYQLLKETSIGTDSYGHPTYIRVYAKYSEQNVSENKTYVYYQARAYHATSCYIQDGGGSGTVGGTGATTVTGACTSQVKGEVTIATTSGWVTHDDDGTKTVTATASLKFPNWGSSWNKSISATATLPSIPRKATLNSAPNFTDEENPSITYTNNAGSSVTTLQACISFDGSNADIAYRDISKTGTSYTFSLTTAERNVLRNACTTANSRTVKFIVKTIIGGVTYYSELTRTLTIVNANPTLSPTVVESDTAMELITGDPSKYLVRYYSNASFAVNASGVKGATIKSVSVVGGGGSSTATSGVIADVTNAEFVFTATDSRGNTATKTVTKTLIPYVELTCNLSAPNPDASGKLTLTVSGNYYNGNLGSTANVLTVQYRASSDGGSTWGNWTAVSATKSGNSYSGTVSITGLDYQKAYAYQARAFDVIREEGVESAKKVVKSTPVFDWGSDDFQFNVPIVYLKHSMADIDARFDTERQDTNRHVSFGVGAGGSNAGVFDYNANKWLVHSDSEGSFYFNQARVLHAISDGSYWGLMNPDRSTEGWVRTTKSGLLPFDNTGTSSLGTSGWPFDNIYGKDFFKGGNPLYGCKNLYNNASGSNGTITLSETAANFSWLEIYYADNNGYEHQSIKVYSPNGKYVQLHSTEASATNVFFRTAQYTVSGTTITPTSGLGGYLSLTRTSGGYANSNWASNHIKIFRVDGRV